MASFVSRKTSFAVINLSHSVLDKDSEMIIRGNLVIPNPYETDFND